MSFGFSVQKQIWKSVGGKSDVDYDTLFRFGDKVDWRRKGEWLHEGDLKFNIQAVKGHLPCDAVTHYTYIEVLLCDPINSFVCDFWGGDDGMGTLHCTHPGVWIDWWEVGWGGLFSRTKTFNL